MAAEIHRKAGRWEEARQHLERVVKLDGHRSRVASAPGGARSGRASGGGLAPQSRACRRYVRHREHGRPLPRAGARRRCGHDLSSPEQEEPGRHAGPRAPRRGAQAKTQKRKGP
jgi:hypothetical protein